MDEQRILKAALCTADLSLIQAVQKTLDNRLSMEVLTDLQTFPTFQSFFSQRSIFHLILVDLTLDSAKSIDQAAKMCMMHPDSRILFITDYLPHVSRAYTVPHFCLLLKSHMDELPYFLRKAAEEVLGTSQKCLELHIRGQSYRLSERNISYLERRGHITYVCQTDGTVTKTREKIDSLLRLQGRGSLIRCHVAFAVNLMYVREIRKQSFVLDSGMLVPISRVNQSFARSAFQNYISKNQKD